MKLTRLIWQWVIKHPVGTKRANELGVYDMNGNVYERCEDWENSQEKENYMYKTMKL